MKQGSKIQLHVRGATPKLVRNGRWKNLRIRWARRWNAALNFLTGTKEAR
ncbi:hypothetical protein AGMMS50276_28550 [Synergistales bacterium]|nr:hypothetical protein AGMMS50276_28550 [Synergistales bacterium]